MAFKSAVSSLSPFRLTVRKMIYNCSGFNKYGLRQDDVLDDQFNLDVREAVRRLPEEVKMQRDYRIAVAQQLQVQHVYLPKEKWIKFEEDESYLKPYLEQVIKERLEKEKWAHEN